ncbi:MAG: hypothetical protein EKK42_22615 [Pseudonocardiaceae bacterium]|nr:NAD(P)H-dependent oxidoreductase [Afipia sp.]RTL64996.1 MAG: hypothetical protein EKK42_22615 [Pseudonocardiaceae bacterium]
MASKAFKDAIAAVDAVLFVIPEYNHSIPGVTCHCRFPPRRVRVWPCEGRTNEASQVYGRADYRGFART